MKKFLSLFLCIVICCVLGLASSEATILEPAPNSSSCDLPLDFFRRLILNGDRYNIQSSSDRTFCPIRVKEDEHILFSVCCDCFWKNDLRRDRLRSELQSVMKIPFGQSVHTSFSFKFDDPSDFGAFKRGIVIAQFHATEDAGDFSGYPILELSINEEGLNIFASSNSSRIQPSAYKRRLLFGPAAINIDEFTKIDLIVKFGFNQDASLKLTINDLPKLDLNGVSIGHNDEIGPYFKFGAYTPAYECRSGLKVLFKDFSSVKYIN